MNGMREIEQDEIELARVFPEEIERVKTGLRDDHGIAGLGKNSLAENERHRLVVHDQDAARDLPGAPRGGLAFGFRRERGMQKNFLVGAADLLHELRRDLGGAIDADPEHFEIFLRAGCAFPDVLEHRDGAGDNLEEIVQFARGRGNAALRLRRFVRVVVALHLESGRRVKGWVVAPLPPKVPVVVPLPPKPV